MKNDFVAVITFISILSLVSVPSPALAGKKVAGKIDTLLKDEQAELKILRRKIAQQENAISKVGKKESAVLKNLQKIGSQLKLKKRELEIYKWNFKNNQKKILSLEPRLKKGEQKIKSHKKILGLRLRSIYKEGAMFPLRVVFSSNNVTDLMQGLKYMDLIVQQDSQMLQEYLTKLEQIKQDKSSLYRVRAKLVSLKKNTVSKKREIEKTKKEKSVYLKKIKRKKNLSVKVRKELLAASNNLNSLIDKLLMKLVSGEGLDISDKKGRLKLPLKGRILNKFGRKRVKEYESYIVYNGINVRARRGTPVQAVFDGKVLYTGELEGYGNLVIVGHGKEYHSLYGHLDSIKVAANKVVKTGEVIALSGDSGSLEGETLYFELRKNGKPIEPVRWFRVAKK
ncbi:peptidoglycan DD-metalloendopeptidase family protein [Nitrospinaceae bacterium]|nr:peptidoglycan DD-metalloendopeptidase family protein [Nitrospinaceae bacterium]